MAGTYVDVPSRRMANDDDGTIGIIRNTTANSALHELNDANREILNEEENSNFLAVGSGSLAGGGDSHNYYIGFMFPELREVDGIHGSTQGNGFGAVDTSGNTTSFFNGTWTNRVTDLNTTAAPYPDFYRTSITSLAVSNVRGLRLAAGGSGASRTVYFVHIYGEISPGETPDRLLVIDELTGLEFTKPIDYGDAPRGGSEDREIRVRNNSSTLTANTIQYTAEAISFGSAAWYTMTLPGGSTYSATQQIASLAPSTTTGIITLRRITPGAEGLGLHAGRLYFNTASWT